MDAMTTPNLVTPNMGSPSIASPLVLGTPTQPTPSTGQPAVTEEDSPPGAGGGVEPLPASPEPMQKLRFGDVDAID